MASSSRSLIERFRKQRPTSRAERNRQRENGEVSQTWWDQEGGGGGGRKEEGRPQRHRGRPQSVLKPASSIKTRTAPVRFSDSLDEPVPSPPMRRSGGGGGGGVDDLIMEDIVDFESARQRPGDPMDGFAESPSYSIERRTTQTRTRFRFTPPRGAFPNEAFDLGHSGPQAAARRPVRLSRNMLKGMAQLTADGPSGALSPGRSGGPSAEAATIEITTTLDTTLAMLQEKFGGAVEGYGGDAGPGCLPAPDYDYVCSENFPSSINAVREKLDAGLTTFRLLYDAKFKQEDDAAQAEADAKKKERREVEDEVRAERLNEEIFGVVNRAVGAVGCIEEDSQAPGRDPSSAIRVTDGCSPDEQMASVMDSVAQRVEMIKRLESGEIDLSGVPPGDMPPLLPSGEVAMEQQRAKCGTPAPLLEQSRVQKQEIYCEQQIRRANLNLEATSKGVVADLEVTMTYMQARLGFNTEAGAGPGDGVDKTGAMESLEEKSERQKEEKKELEKQANIAKLQAKIDEEDQMERTREYTDRLDLALLGEDDDDEIDGRPEFVNWDLYKTQSLDMGELLAARRNAGLQPTTHRPTPPSWFEPPPMPHPGSYPVAPQPMFEYPTPSAPPPPTGDELTGEPRANARVTGGPSYTPVMRHFTGIAGGGGTVGLFGGANTYADSSEIISIEDSKERLARFRKVREAAEYAGKEENLYSARLSAPAELKDPSDIEDARARLDEFRAMRAAATRVLQVGS